MIARSCAAYYPSPTFSLPTRIPLSIISHFNSRTTAGPTIVLSNSLRSASTSALWGSLLVNPGEVEADVTILTIMVTRGEGCDLNGEPPTTRLLAAFNQPGIVMTHGRVTAVRISCRWTKPSPAQDSASALQTLTCSTTSATSWACPVRASGAPIWRVGAVACAVALALDVCAAGSMGFCPRTILAVFCTAGSWCYSKTGQASAGDGFHDYGEKYTTGTSVPTTPASGR